MFSTMLHKYREIISQTTQPNNILRSLDDKVSHFKKQFANSFYACRFWGCGQYFGTVKELEVHEVLHTGGMMCMEPSCSFSRIGFSSARALRQHVLRYHAPEESEPRCVPTAVRKNFICTAVTDGITHGCNRRFALENELDRHRASRKGTFCDSHHVRMQKLNALLSTLAQAPDSVPTWLDSFDGLAGEENLICKLEELSRARDKIQQDPGIIARMDNLLFSPNPAQSQMWRNAPLNVATWAHLKQWKIENPDLMAELDLHKIFLLQVALGARLDQEKKSSPKDDPEPSNKRRRSSTPPTRTIEPSLIFNYQAPKISNDDVLHQLSSQTQPSEDRTALPKTERPTTLALPNALTTEDVDDLFKRDREEEIPETSQFDDAFFGFGES